MNHQPALPRFITHFVIGAVLFGAAAAAEPPGELRAARFRYDTAVAAATKPLRERYVFDLNQLRSQAVLKKDAELVAAIETELRAIAPATALATPSSAATPAPVSTILATASPRPGGPQSNAPLKDFLPGTKWLPQRTGTKWQSIVFTLDEKVVITGADGKGRDFAYEITKDGHGIIGMWSNRSVAATVQFSRDRKTAEYEMVRFKLAAGE